MDVKKLNTVQRWWLLQCITYFVGLRADVLYCWSLLRYSTFECPLIHFEWWSGWILLYCRTFTSQSIRCTTDHGPFSFAGQLYQCNFVNFMNFTEYLVFCMENSFSRLNNTRMMYQRRLAVKKVLTKKKCQLPLVRDQQRKKKKTFAPPGNKPCTNL